MWLHRPIERPQAHRDILALFELLPNHLGVIAVFPHLGPQPFIEPGKGSRA
jgi:hypothetical protein